MLDGKESFVRRFRRQHPLRLHMTAILLAKACAGGLFCKVTLAFSVDNFVIRYPLAVVFSYLVFFFCIKLWLWYVSPRRSCRVSDWLDLPSPSGGSGGGGLPPLRGGGGSFGGGGASGSFEADSSLFAEAPVSVTRASSTLSEKAVDGIGEAVGALGEGGGAGIVVFAVLSILIATILGSAVYVFSEAPMILSDAAFEGLLAASLVKKVRLIDDENWIGSVLKTTCKTFATILAVTFVAALTLHHYFPKAARLSEILFIH